MIIYSSGNVMPEVEDFEFLEDLMLRDNADSSYIFDEDDGSDCD